MGFFDWFRKRKTKEEIEDDRKDKKLPEQEARERRENREHLIMDRCEEVLETLDRIDDSRKEYQVLTDQILDLELLEALGGYDIREIQDLAHKVIDDEKRRDEAMKKESKLTKEQFALMQKKEAEVEDSLRKLEENEDYQKAVKRDMHTLEGEKSVWQREREELLMERERYRVLPLAGLVTYVVLMALMMVISYFSRTNMTLGYLFLTFAMALIVAWLVYQMSTFQRRLKQTEKNLNYTIDLLNKTKFKYVHVTAAVDYTYEKFRINSSHELIYLWEQYQQTIRDREQYHNAKMDLEQDSFRLVKVLAEYQFRQPEIWSTDLEVLLEPEVLEEKRRQINRRREKLRSIIDYSMEVIKNSREDMARMAANAGGLEKELLGVLKAIDRICEGV